MMQIATLILLQIRINNNEILKIFSGHMLTVLLLIVRDNDVVEPSEW